MIAGLRGLVAGKTNDSLLIDCAGVVYRVGTSTSTLSEVGADGDPVAVLTYLVVREDALALFGFATSEELSFFEILIGVTGIGPRLACAVLSTFKPESLFGAIREGDVDLIATVPGIGKKTAARIIVDLRGKLPAGMVGGAGERPGDLDLIEALRALGYTSPEIQQAMVRAVFDPGMTVEERIVATLQQIGER